MTIKLSLIMIVKNEADNLASCLKSVKGLAQEIIVVDSGSQDETVSIAQSFGAKIYKRDFDSFTLQKNYALSKAAGEWVLNLDGDEALSDALREEIKNTLPATDKAGFMLPIANEFLGRKMKHSGLKRVMKLRLAKRAQAAYTGGKIHEALRVEGPVGVLKNIVTHRPYRSIHQYFNKFNFYSTLAAQSMHERGKKFSYLQLLRPFFDFFKTYVLRLGFLDGLEGFLWAYLGAQYPLVKYVKLKRLHSLQEEE
ncbi:MAG: glycosyltransferase family 2 protein [Elusimicrobiota bacterium]|jgi:glycosyltransferase involved in cell wall biosynthesis|nr:glycosyltransferase family 2 protein [Elusimicrobiota bacterium]